MANGLTKPAARRTSRSVHIWDRAAEVVITGGGLAVLASVLGICVYLFYEVAPLFSPGRAEAVVAGSAEDQLGEAVAVFPGEFGEAAAWLSADGQLTFTLLTGEGEVGRVFGSEDLTPGESRMTAWSARPGGGAIALGFNDGTVVYGTIGFDRRVVAASGLSEAERALPVGGVLVRGEGADAEWLSRPREDIYRIASPVVSLTAPFMIGDDGAPVTAIDFQVNAAGQRVIAAIREDGTGVFGRLTERRPLGGGTPTIRTRAYGLDLGGRSADRVFVSADGGDVLALNLDGTVRRFHTEEATRDELVPVAETTRVTPEGVGVASVGWLLGAQSLLVSADDGSGGSWFVAPGAGEETTDGRALVRAHPLGATDAASALASARNDRIAAMVSPEGRVTVWHQTSDKRLASIETSVDDPGLLAVGPRGDLLLVAGSGGAFELLALDPGHAEASFRSIFGRVHYENTEGPGFVYQSSAGSDAAEVKLSLTPLIWGTLKATLFAMLFAVPVAVLAALYSSEFMSPKLHRVVKPSLELMASLPSVVLGFIAAFVVAPIAAERLPTLLALVYVLPAVAVVGAMIWQAVPGHLTRRLGTGWRLVIIGLAMLLGIGLAAIVGPRGEALLFTPNENEVLIAAGSYEPVSNDRVRELFGETKPPRPALRAQGMAYRDGGVVRAVEPQGQRAAEIGSIIEEGDLATPSFRRWLDGAFGGGSGGWLLLFGLPCAMLAVVVSKRFGARTLGETAAGDALLTIGAVAGGLLVAWGLAGAAAALGFDPRTSLFGPFDQRNTLVVAIIMGFAVIPIIYTISDDAMRSVPEGLRSASLGAGATPWQTAVRIVLPVAGSGVFSAIMIGLGRAVGETMIVLMATGNTPEMDLNIFSGFRTLAANIAVELPEAPKGGTHYRVLFLCGLVLFAMTFIINTTAEIVRQRFRKRSASL